MKEKKKYIKNTEKPIQNYRFYVQSAFALLCVWIGFEVYLFTRYLESGGTTDFFSRPPGVDGFLPISSMMSFYLFLTTGEIHQAHPAGMFIFAGIVFVSLVFGKSFCSWLCPVGFLSELVGDAGDRFLKKVFKKKKRLQLPKFLDYPLRSLKYLLLGFFVYSIFFLMTDFALKAFLDSPYNIVADVKMYYFFADISRLSLIVISALFVLSIFIRNFWCRFLCPYGALLGVMSLISPNKIKRDPVSCIDCGLCAKACPSFIKVDVVKTVISDECTACLNCVDVCPVENTLQLEIVGTKKKINKKLVGALIAGLFMLVTGIGMVTGNWQNKVTKEEYLYHYQIMNSYGHPTGKTAIEDLNRESENK